MIPALKSEFRKILTVRSTYFLLAGCLAVTILFAFYIFGYHLSKDVVDPFDLAASTTGAAGALGLFIALCGVLLLTHEYRYNTIVYTLTASRSRSTVLLAKIIAVSVFALLLGLVISVLAPALTYLGVHLKGLTMVPQTLDVGHLLWRAEFYIWGYSMMALLIATIVKNQVGTIGILFLFPGLAELLLGLLLKDNTKYLPFRALSNVVQDAVPGAGPMLSQGRAALVVLAYLVVGWIVAWVLFLRRDAV